MRVNFREGKGEKSRNTLMDKLQTFLPANIMLPPSRLHVLLNQALELQTLRCQHHNTTQGPALHNCTLLLDHSCSKDSFPTHTVQILNDHCDEVWFCQFSPDGNHLATGSKDTNVFIWDVHPDTCSLTLKSTLDGHTYGMSDFHCSGLFIDCFRRGVPFMEPRLEISIGVRIRRESRCVVVEHRE